MPTLKFVEQAHLYVCSRLEECLLNYIGTGLDGHQFPQTVSEIQSMSSSTAIYKRLGVMACHQISGITWETNWMITF